MRILRRARVRAVVLRLYTIDSQRCHQYLTVFSGRWLFVSPA